MGSLGRYSLNQGSPMKFSGLEVLVGLLFLGGAVLGFNCGFNDSFAEEQELLEQDRTGHESNSFYNWPVISGRRVVSFYFFHLFPVTEETKNIARGIFQEFETKACVKFVEESPTWRKKQLGLQIEAHTAGSVGGSVNGNYHMSLWVSRSPRSPNDVRWRQLFYHEVFHAFGITHTQRRKDRDIYVQMNWDNIEHGQFNSQYHRCDWCKVPENVPYECTSIMHYRQSAFRKEGKGPTMYGLKAGPPNFCSRYFTRSEEPTVNDWLSLNVKLGCSNN